MAFHFRHVCTALVWVFPVCFTAAPLKVDFSIAGRSDSIAPHFEQWMPKAAPTDQKRFGSLTVTLSKAGPVGTALKSVWWKGGALDGGRMAVDGVSVDNGDGGGQLEMRITGLAPGRHSLTTYHNISEDDAKSPHGKIDILLNGTPKITGLAPSRRAMDDDAQLAHFEFDAGADGEAVVLFRPAESDPSARCRNVVLCGFVLDGSNPSLVARKPLPANDDEHVEAERGLTLAWSPGKSAVGHQIFFGKTHAAVAAATTDSPEFLGLQPTASRAVSGVSPLDQYFWRIDEVDSAGKITRGEVWRFRPRRIAFPGAEGYGRFAIGGRGGRVIEVTNLNDAGPGSLRVAVEAEGPRTVVFAVSGLITLESKLVIKNPYLTIAGETAPGKGIATRKYTIGMIGTHDVVVRHLRVRPGDIAGDTLDGMGMAASDHSIYDHCSISWSIDEAFSSRGAKNITLQRTLISESLNNAGHRKYEVGKQHGFAASIGGMVGSFHHNLLAHNSGRNWSLAGGLDGATRHAGWLDIRNNVVYNWQNRTTDGGAAKVNYVANYYKPGPSTKVFMLLNPERKLVRAFGPQMYYLEGNVLEGRFIADDRLGGVTKPEPYANFISEQPFFDSHVATQSARAAYKVVLSDVGATAPVVDDHDARIVAETLAGTTTFKGSRTGLPGIPDSQMDVGGWEDYPEVKRADGWDGDHDGLPDWWEKLHGTNPSSPSGNYSDANADGNGDGFTNLENYLAWMAAPHFSTEADRPVNVDLSPLARGFTDRPVFALSGASGGEVTLLSDGKTARFVPTAGRAGLGEFSFVVTDSDSDTMKRTVGIFIP